MSSFKFPESFKPVAQEIFCGSASRGGGGGAQCALG